MFEFKKDNQDQRAEFANDVCQLIIDKHHGVIEAAAGSLKKIRAYFNENVRNIYELVDSEIPLFALYELMNNGADNYGFTWEEYNDALERSHNKHSTIVLCFINCYRYFFNKC
jgi:hypothetical protein